MTGDHRFRPLDRIRRRSEYQTIYHKGRRIPSGKFVLFVMQNSWGRPRLGITMTKRVGGAVRRNRAKRLVREIFRKHKSEWKCIDIVVNGRPGLHQVPYEELEADFLKRLRPYRKAS
ncbi:MAG: ribonuclease P protein component [Acidobacteria bacterium]|nr:ribonuclease P protein component [Acidobacteriota bacterium]